MTWLLVEDDSDIRNVVSVMISVWGEKPLAFPDGNAAWSWLDSVMNGKFAGELPDLALMDIRMPGYTGDKIAARIRETPAVKDIPIILMTAFSLTEAEIRVMMDQAGIDYLINKPLPDMDVFRATLYRVRDERRAKVAAQKAAAQAAPPPSTEPPAGPPPVQPAAPPAQPAAPTAATPVSKPTTPATQQATPAVQPAAPAAQPATTPKPEPPKPS